MENTFLSFEKYSLLEKRDLSWESIFGTKYTHREELEKMVLYGIYHIIEEEKKISEKDFSRHDEEVSKIKRVLNQEIYDKAEAHLQSNRRMQLFYENLYEEIKEKLI